MKRAFRIFPVLGLAGVAGCASGGAPADPRDDSVNLAGYADRAVLVLPMQRVSDIPNLASSQSPAALAFREAMDYELRFAFGDEPPRRWVWAPAIITIARRNAGVTADPMRLSIEGLTGKLPEPEEPISESLRTQVRQLIALTDARYVLIPVSVRSFERPNGMRRATMRVVLVDGRLATVRWAEDISIEPAPAFNRTVAAGLASRLAVMAGLR